MKAVHVISGISREGGGPSRSSQALVAALNAAGCETWLLSCHGGDVVWVEGVTHFATPQVGERLTNFFVRQFATIKPDVVHLHGIWDWQIHLAAKVARALGIPYVVAPRGMLEPWSLAHKKWKKRLAMALYQRNDLRKAVALHATAHREAEQFRGLGFTQMIIESPNGVIVPTAKGNPSTSNMNNHGSRRVLFVSRMHAKKGVLELVEAWARVKRERQVVVSNAVTENWYDVVEPGIVRALPSVRVDPSSPRLSDRRAVKDVFRAFGLVENAADGRRVLFPSKSVGKMLGQRGIDLYRVAGSFSKLFRLSRRAWSETEASIDNHKTHRNIGAYHQYIAKFDDGGDECFIRFTVREERGTGVRNEVHSSTVSRITVYKAKGAELSNLGHAQAEDSTPFVDNKISYFFSRVNPQDWQCELVYTLNGEEERAYEARVKKKIEEQGLSYGTELTSNADFILTGPLNDDAKWAAYARADLFVLPTYSENFGIVVAEALWAGVPVITTKGAPWQELEECHCGWWIDLPPKASLDAALREAMALPQETLRAMGARGRRLVEEKYTWKAVCDAMMEGYRRILAGNRLAV